MKIGNNKYHGFLIDADNTIFDYDRCEKEAFLETLLSVNFSGSIDNAYLKFRFINQALWKDFEQNKIDAGSLNRERFKILFKTLKIDANIKTLAASYLDNLSQKIYTLPNTVKTLEFLSKRATLCLITNGLSYVQRNRIARAELEIFFSAIIISEEIGHAKPAVRFFQTALEQIKLPPHAVLCVGDSPSSDIKGGYLYGIDTCWYIYKHMNYPQSEPLPDYMISDFIELEKFAPEIS